MEVSEIEKLTTELLQDLENKPIVEEPVNINVKNVPMEDVLETILDQGGAEGKLMSGSPYVSINKEYWAKISTENGKKWIKVLKVEENGGVRFTREDGQTFLETKETPKPTTIYSWENFPNGKTLQAMPVPEENLQELRNMVLSNIKAVMRDQDDLLIDIDKLKALKKTINALSWFNEHQTKPTFWQKIWLKIKGNYWSF